MENYTKFLLPLLEAFPPDSCTPVMTCPQDEESHLINRYGDQLDWQCLADRAKAVYGIEMIITPPRSMRPKSLVPGQEQTVGRRLLLLEGSGQRLWVLEHPSLILQFDRFTKAGDLPRLARPSLFAKWYGACTDPTGSAGSASSKTQFSADEDSLAALHRFLRELLEAKPSDWHLEPALEGFRSRIRVNGKLTRAKLLSANFGAWLIHSIQRQSCLDGKAPGQPLDGAFTIPMNTNADMPARVSMVPSVNGYTVATRFLYPRRGGDMEGLGMTSRQRDRVMGAYAQPDGLWLVAGPTGCGKSTTLFALLERSINKGEKVLAAEDPVEHVTAGVQQVQVDPDNGMTFATALRAFLRQAPDSMLIGEVRDVDTAEIALQGALTGHRVLGTIHARDNASVIHRFEDLRQEGNLIRSATRQVIHQRLVRHLCPRCKKRMKLPKALLNAKPDFPVDLPDYHYVATACEYCSEGYSSRGGVFSVGELDPREDVFRQLQEHALQMWVQAKTDLYSVAPFIPNHYQRHFRFANRKDFANYGRNHTP